MTDVDGKIFAIFIEFSLSSQMHFYISSLVDHDMSKKHGAYVFKYGDLISHCITNKIAILRLGPKVDVLKTGLGAVAFPLCVVDNPVWFQIGSHVAVVSYGIMTSIALALYVFLTQWHLNEDALSLKEFAILYFWCMLFVKVIPLLSLGLTFFKNPIKYLKQTTFYAQGILVGLGPALYHISKSRPSASVLRLIDGLAMFAFLAEAIGRLGCHFYGCCFGRPLKRTSPFSVLYLNKNSSVARLHPDCHMRPLIPTQAGQALFAIMCFIWMLRLRRYEMPYGMVFCMFMYLYSVDRMLFFFVRFDECYKKKRSFTTLYIAVGTLLLTMCLSIYMYQWHADTCDQRSHLLPMVPLATLGKHVSIAILLSSINLIVQGFHNPNKIGQFCWSK